MLPEKKDADWRCSRSWQLQLKAIQANMDEIGGNKKKMKACTTRHCGTGFSGPLHDQRRFRAHGRKDLEI
jgi:hypothetical protein